MVNGIGVADHAYRPATSVGRDRGAAPRGRTESDDDVVGSQLVEPAGDEPSDGEARGVLRNLEAGHFRGVADLRLRINFADQILTAELEAASRVASQTAADFVADANVAIDEFVGAVGEPTDEQQAAVERARNVFATALSDATAAGLSSDDLVAALSGSIEQFITTLSSIFAPPPIDPLPEGADALGVTEATGEAESTDAEPGVTAIVDELAEALGIALGEFESSSGTVSTLPPPSSPSGNGVAYAKFLSEYNELYGTPDSEPSETASIDVQA